MPQIIEINDHVKVFLAPIEAGSNRREDERAATARLMEAAAGGPCEISHREDGSPYPTLGNMEISVSHSRHCVALAVSLRGRVGVDIEEARTGQLRRVAPRVLSEAEMAVYGADDEGLLWAWTLKEAAYKAVAGAPADLRAIELPIRSGDTYINIRKNGGTVRARVLWSGAVPGRGWMSVVEGSEYSEISENSENSD